MLKELSPLIMSYIEKMNFEDEIIFTDTLSSINCYRPNTFSINNLDIPLVITQLCVVPQFKLERSTNREMKIVAVLSENSTKSLEVKCSENIKNSYLSVPCIQRLDSYTFYERSKQSVAVIMTSENNSEYGSIILRKAL